MARPLALASSILVGAVAITACLVYSMLGSCTLEIAPAGASGPVPILLVTAHPDDEAMFFAPSLLAVARANCCRVFILCLSNGNADGLGPLRAVELLAAAPLLGVQPTDVSVVDDPGLQDGKKQRWDQATARQLIRTAIQEHGVQMVLTFDGDGVSGHPNHKAVHEAVRAVAQEAPAATPVRYWELLSMGVVRKFLGPLDVAFSIFECQTLHRMGGGCCIEGAAAASAASMRQHASQNVWFRRWFVLLSRYSYINSWRPIMIESESLDSES
ncbi:N-acetylglucosaminylphosphatidylinositol deacetylase [Klebsormidium nitens]|uniref:N-acetylglucosaminylphosphatidylinositol deacetylase n=1 Tax=Klebsormidium nitens TaxID=105231 RepID=A0A1Y1IP53_KLENI|nr:N-acetylglucosaminylphosphatidylinositol deacetylase [Klebsormidium nitens]|eukprot:GAQ90951.1 N-acetylglucosaminylphosphatidylinositol deacetylase [Klebsormidium nitens]